MPITEEIITGVAHTYLMIRVVLFDDAEVVSHILAIMRKLGVRWQRTPKQPPRWRDSL